MAKNGENGSSTENEEHEETFEGEFDAERAKRLIANLRDEVRDLKESKQTLQVEADKVSALEERLAEAETGTKEARKALFVARAQAKHGLSDEEAQEFLSDLDDEDKILARAERLAGLRGPGSQEEPGGDEDGEDGSGDESDGLSDKPKPGLIPGTGGEADEVVDEDALFKAARERRGY